MVTDFYEIELDVTLSEIKGIPANVGVIWNVAIWELRVLISPKKENKKKSSLHTFLKSLIKNETLVFENTVLKKFQN